MESVISLNDPLQSDQGLIQMESSSYFRSLSLERVAGVQCGEEYQEKWWVKGWYKIPDNPRIVQEIMSDG